MLQDSFGSKNRKVAKNGVDVIDVASERDAASFTDLVGCALVVGMGVSEREQ